MKRHARDDRARGGLRRVITVAVSSAVTLALAGGYLVADLTDVLPGMLTLRQTEERAASPAPMALTGDTNLVGDVRRGKSIDAEAAASLIKELAAASGVGSDLSVAIADDSGTIVAERNSATPREPASTAKTLTALAATLTLDMSVGLDTEAYVSQVADGSATVTLKGHGDMLLSEGKSDPAHINGRAGLGTLAERTAEALREQGVTRVRVLFDDSLFGSSDRYPAGIEENNGDHEYYTAIATMAVDGGRQWTEEESRPANPDDSGDYPTLSHEPAKDAANAFAKRLEETGLALEGGISVGEAPADSNPAAKVTSAPLSEVLAFMLRHSDNTLAELFGRLTALALGEENSIAGDVKAVGRVLREQGVPTEGMVLTSCSGLAPGTALDVRTLIAVQTRLLEPNAPGAAALEGLSVPGLVGTARSRVSDTETNGLIRVKTGSLIGVSSLSGNVSRKAGGTLSFAVIVNNAPNTWEAAKAIDDFAAALTDL